MGELVVLFSSGMSDSRSLRFQKLVKTVEQCRTLYQEQGYPHAWKLAVYTFSLLTGDWSAIMWRIIAMYTRQTGS